jgi:hypothetical protein
MWWGPSEPADGV